jgi:6-phosphogluconolactonase
LSLTFRALDAANEVWFIAAGDGKADAVARAVGGAPREEVPSAGPRGRIRTLWLIDQAAASKLPAS